MYRATLLGAAALLLAGCGGESPERTAARIAAHRDWCIAEELAVQANAQLSTLDTLGGAGGDGLNQMLYPFTRAFYDFAKSREVELALMDSAVSAATSEDSTTLAGRAAQARPAAPSNQVASNAARDYQRRFADALGNPAHPCNTAAAAAAER